MRRAILSREMSTAAVNAGANVVVKKPITVDGVTLHITLAKELMMSEQRRHFRHPVNLHVLLKDEDSLSFDKR
jgi:hypothetical protein